MLGFTSIAGSPLAATGVVFTPVTTTGYEYVVFARHRGCR